MEQHHIRRKLCTSRAKYRQGRELKAVKTYTVAQESQFILVLGLPAIHIQDKLVKFMGKFGTIVDSRHLKDYPSEEFTEAMLFKYQRIQSARAAKRKTDNKSFFGGVLHVCYAPEYETVDEVRKKMKDREFSYSRRLAQLEREKASTKHHKGTEQDDGNFEEEEEDVEKTLASEDTSAEDLNPPDDRFVHPANLGGYPSQQRESLPYASTSNEAQYPTFPPQLPLPPCNTNPPPGYFPPPLPQPICNTTQPPPPPGHPYSNLPPSPNLPQHGPPPRSNCHPSAFPTNARHSNARPPGRNTTWTTSSYGNPPRFSSPVNGAPRQLNQMNAQTIPPNPPNHAPPRPANALNLVPSISQQSFPLAGPAPPCGPYIPNDYKTESQNKDSWRGKRGKNKWQKSDDKDTQGKPAPPKVVTPQPSAPQTNVVIKKYQPSKETAKFIPRQVSKVSLPKHLTSKDPVSETLRKNALTLKEIAAGPNLPPENQEEHEMKRAMKRKDPEMDKVMESIRNRVKQFAEKAMLPPQLKKKKT